MAFSLEQLYINTNITNQLSYCFRMGNTIRAHKQHDKSLFTNVNDCVSLCKAHLNKTVHMDFATKALSQLVKLHSYTSKTQQDYANVNMNPLNKDAQIFQCLYNKSDKGMEILLPFKYSSFFQYISKVDIGINKIWIQSNSLLQMMNKEHLKNTFIGRQPPLANCKSFSTEQIATTSLIKHKM